MPRKLTTQKFIEKAITVHGDKYDYSEVKYINAYTKVEIVCPEHGVFEQIPYNHLRGNGCPKCGVENKKSSKDEFIKRAKNIHGNKYDYSKVDYVNARIKVKITCPDHGPFWQTPNNHLNGNDCPKCSGNKKSSKEEFIEKAITVHGYKYDYLRVNYVNSYTKVKITCPDHGPFLQRPDGHLMGRGCPKCGVENKKSSKDEFIKRAKNIHGNKYDYSKVDYVNNYTKIEIVCQKHGPFLQTPANHLIGKGCPKCPITISRPEQELADYIMSLGHGIIQSHRGWCPDRPQLEIDIYIPSLNLGFEFNGSYWHSLRDKNYHKEKTLVAIDNNIKLIHIWEDKWRNNPESVKRMIRERLR